MRDGAHTVLDERQDDFEDSSIGDTNLCSSRGLLCGLSACVQHKSRLLAGRGGCLCRLPGTKRHQQTTQCRQTTLSYRFQIDHSHCPNKIGNQWRRFFSEVIFTIFVTPRRQLATMATYSLRRATQKPWFSFLISYLTLGLRSDVMTKKVHISASHGK